MRERTPQAVERLVALDFPGSICNHLPRRSPARDLTMDVDVELMRDLLFELEARQTSPRSVVIVSVDEEAIALERHVGEIETGLSSLLELDYIDGPGVDAPGFFLFRKLTRKGTQFVRQTRSPRDWEAMKRYFAQRSIEDNA